MVPDHLRDRNHLENAEVELVEIGAQVPFKRNLFRLGDFFLQ